MEKLNVKIRNRSSQVILAFKGTDIVCQTAIYLLTHFVISGQLCEMIHDQERAASDPDASYD